MHGILRTDRQAPAVVISMMLLAWFRDQAICHAIIRPKHGPRLSKAKEHNVTRGPTFAASAISLLMLVLALTYPAYATWKPQYRQSPQSVQDWFVTARTTPAARAGLKIGGCCEQAERLKTKFILRENTDWSYYLDPTCTQAGCPLRPIKSDVVHDDPIRAFYPEDDDLPEFKAMRREGVLFVWKHEPTCFWPPEPGI
jgi:hypothetical protein